MGLNRVVRGLKIFILALPCFCDEIFWFFIEKFGSKNLKKIKKSDPWWMRKMKIFLIEYKKIIRIKNGENSL